MTAATNIQPGAIRWIPKAHHVPAPASNDQYSTLPERCFGHPVIVLYTEPSKNTAVILIISSFHRGKKIKSKIEYRRHQISHYLPIHPSPSLADGTPVLHLSGSQKFLRDNWVHIGTSYTCPIAWLGKVWKRGWHDPHGAERLSSDALKTLAKYALAQGCDARVYSQVLSACTIKEAKKQKIIHLPAVKQPLLTSTTQTHPPRPQTHRVIRTVRTQDYGALYQSYPRIYIDPLPSSSESTNPFTYAAESRQYEPFATREGLWKICRFLGSIALLTLKAAACLAPFVIVGYGLWWLVSYIIWFWNNVIVVDVLAAWNQVKVWLESLKRVWESIVGI